MAHVAQVRGGHGKDDRIGTVKRLGELGRCFHVVRQLVSHQITGVTVLAIDAGGRLLAMGPHDHALGSRGSKAGDRRFPRSRSQQLQYS